MNRRGLCQRAIIGIVAMFGVKRCAPDISAAATPVDCWIRWHDYLFVCKQDLVGYYSLGRKRTISDWIILPDDRIEEMSIDKGHLFLRGHCSKYEVQPSAKKDAPPFVAHVL